MRRDWGHFWVSTAGSLVLASLLALLSLALPASARAPKRRHHATVDRIAPTDRRPLVERRRAPIDRRRVQVHRRRALTQRPEGRSEGGGAIDEGGAIDGGGVRTDPLPAPGPEPAPPQDAAVTQPEGSRPSTSAATPPPEASTHPPVPPVEAEASAPALYWGASIGDHLTGTQAPWDMNAVSKFEELVGKPLSLVNVFVPFADCSRTPCSFYEFDPEMMEGIREHGAIPVYSWSSQSIPSSLDEPDFQLSDVIAGGYDSYIRSFAEGARDWGHPFFLRFDWEMNGGWFPWAEGANGNQQGEFVAAWRHVHDIFASVGATNVNWVWCPNVDPDGIFQGLGPLYPGDAYVDWTGLDGYNWGTNPVKPDRWRSFDELFGSTYHQIADTIAPTKPMLIGEMGSTEVGGSKAGWIEDALAKIPSAYPKLGGLLWFETYIEGMDWPIESSSAATDAFAEGIGSPAYAGNDYAELAGGPIQPPSRP